MKLCQGKNCPLKLSCARLLSIPDVYPLNTSSFLPDTPFKTVRRSEGISGIDSVECEKYIAPKDVSKHIASGQD